MNKRFKMTGEPREGDSYTRLYGIWSRMKCRCANPNDVSFSLYGGRGVSVCDEWQTFPPFRDWALANGYSDSLTIDRIDPDGDYAPENCRWADWYTQNRNRRNNRLTAEQVHEIRTSSVRRGLLAKKFNVSPRQVSRVRAGTSWPVVEDKNGNAA